uniref:USP domain-containing protein n=1 Tax=Chrysotila carterae TaxID=13221 RepID=A0A7S4BAA5_CHRCT
MKPLPRNVIAASQELMLTKLFQGKQCYSVTCCECGHTSHTDDVFEDLKLPMLAESQGHALGSGAPEEQSSAASATNGLRRTLRNLLLPEALRGDEQYWCDHCARKVDAERRVSLCSLPPILAFQLKRFRYDLRTGQRSKINSSLPFPTELDMSEFVSDPRSRGTDVVQTSCQESGPTGTDGLNKPVSQEAARNDREADEGGDSGSKGDSTGAESGGGGSGDGGEAQCNSGFGAACRGDSAEAAEVVREKSLQYELYAVLVHSGSASFGHYYALIKDLEEGDWHEFNDSVVRPIKASDLSKTFGGAESGWGASAYMLLYRQVDATPAANANGRECIRSMSPTSEATSSVEAHACVVGGDGDGAMDADGFVVVKRSSRHSKRSRREQSTASQAQGAQDISNDLVDKILKDSLETDLSDKKKEEEDPNPYTAMGF